MPSFNLQVRFSGSTTSVDIMPIGINVNMWNELCGKEQVKKRAAEIRSMYKGKKIIVGLDALDETMGIHHKLVAVRDASCTSAGPGLDSSTKQSVRHVLGALS